MSSVLDHMTSAVARIKTVRESVILLLTSLAEKVRNGSNDPVALESIATALESEASLMADAVVAATPVAPSGLGVGPAAAPPEPITADTFSLNEQAAASALTEQERVQLALAQKEHDDTEARRIAEATTSNL